ncbi:uncharacterized protein LACBIDRAFT_327273 [Laccaria bicolor S238N-H82]|uniref:Predicted protein n=1 Tax=Laccaria bicolor (strain S238N-H82 / ATCC MYA-4686) TaxID=486041 RepID=B0DBQ1_LACBS|nr:uncharacterized protein LACBIDRAFT_327273 [Laccaria bicolor S238N-H82]EDR08221.1 predicted protein [Laccaria bicolor S238N-H82]|eukprot:XP_001881291.1 predicted protein [Laccaria bicolor S238N-H82]
MRSIGSYADKPPSEKASDEPPIPPTTTITTNDENTISLDDISCSLYPYAFPPRNISRSSHNLAIQASRSSHNLAIASRHASRSSHNLAIASRNASRSSHNLVPESVFGPDSLRAESVNEYTITYQSPSDPSTSPTSPRAGYSFSSPHLLRPNSRSSFPPRERRSRSASPGPSIVAIPEGDVVIQLEDVIHSPSSEVKPALGDDRIYPLAPEFFQRYDRVNHIRIHQDGLFMPIQKVYRTFTTRKRVYTEANLYDEDFLHKVDEDIDTIEDFLQLHGIRLGPTVDLALDLNRLEDGIIATDYYYADHERRIIFFLDEFESTNLPAWSQVTGVNSLSHLRTLSRFMNSRQDTLTMLPNLGIEFEAQYWFSLSHVSLCTLSNVLRAVRVVDSMTSPYSTAPYNLEDLYKILSLTDSLKGRFMYVFIRQRFFDFHGQPCARLDRDQTVYEGVTEKRTLLIKSLSPLLFNAPDVHLRNLEKMWVDGLMHKAVWLQSIAKLNEEWQEFVLYATVILNANVAFLAIQSIDDSAPPYRSPTQVASYLSIIASIGSIILGLLLVRQNRSKEEGTSDDAPPVCSTNVGANPATRAIVGIAILSICVLIFWCIWMAWDKKSADPVDAAAVPVDVDGDGSAKNLSQQDIEKNDTPSLTSMYLSRPPAGRSLWLVLFVLVLVGYGIADRSGLLSPKRPVTPCSWYKRSEWAVLYRPQSSEFAAANAQLFLMLVLSLHRLLLAFRRLLFGKPIFHNALQRLLRRLALFWSLLRPRRRFGGTSRPTPDKPPSEKPSSEPPIPPPTTISTNDKNTISLDDISCSLYPYAYPPRNITLSSHNLGIQASRSSHNLAIASRHASRSSHNLAIASRNASRSSHTLVPESGVFGPDSLRAESLNEYTIPYQSPSDPSTSPTSPRAGYSFSSQSRSASPGPSIVAIPEGDVVIQLEDVIHSPSSEVKPALVDDRIFPLAPQFFQRYDRVNRIYKNPPGWTFYAHPEGVPYFYHAEKVLQTPLVLAHHFIVVTEDIATIEEFLELHGIRLGPTVDLALDLNRSEDGTIITDYYYADHERRIIFFLDEFESSNLPAWSQVPGVNSLSHLRTLSRFMNSRQDTLTMLPNIGIEFEVQYWFGLLHVSLCTISNVLRAVRVVDSMTSPYSTAPYNLEDLYKILSLTNSLKGRFMHIFARQKFFDFHGQPCARLHRGQTVYEGVTEKRTLLIKSLSPLLFNAPDVHLRNLEKMWVDGLMYKDVWLQSIAKLNEEWQEFVLYATVILIANVFLAIQSIDDSAPRYRSLTQVASYLSIIASIASVILGLLFVRQNRSKEEGTSDDAKANPATRAIVGIAILSICVLILWCIWMAWDKKPADPVDAAAAPIDSAGDGSAKNLSQQDVRGLGLRWIWPNIFRKYSYDSGTTVV